MRAILASILLFWSGAALAQAPLPAPAPSPQLEDPRIIPLPDTPGAGPSVWLSTSQLGGRAARGLPMLSNQMTLIAPGDGDYWVIVEGWSPRGAMLTVTVAGNMVHAALPPCPDACGRAAPLGLVLEEGDMVQIRLQARAPGAAPPLARAVPLL